MIQPTDIVFTLSNGTNGPNNSNPNLSLGFTPSGIAVTTTIENLFESLDTDQAQSGRIDYRCFYVFNNSLSDSLPSAAVYLDNQLDSTAQLTVGVVVSNDQQKMTVTNPMSGGFIKLSYDGVETGQINYGGSVLTFATNIAAALNALASLSGVTCSSNDFISYSSYDITFAGSDSGKYHPLVVLSVNSLNGSPEINITKIINGSPINTIAPTITNALQAPAGIPFVSTAASNRLNIGTLGPTEGFSIWIKREVPAGTYASAASGATFKLYGVPF